MLQELNLLFQQGLVFSKANPIIASALGLWGLSAVTLFFRDIPNRIYKFIVRQCTTTLELNSQDRIFHEFLEWLSKNKMHSFVRTINIHSGLHKGAGGYIDRLGTKGISLGYGNTFFFHNRRFFTINRYKDQASNTEQTKEVLTLTVLGRSHKVFNELFSTVKEDNKEDSTDKTRVYRYSNDFWDHICDNFKRNPDTVIINKEDHDKLYGTIDTFLANKEWYKKNGVPYKLGILLYGPPGTGKTSLIKAVCAKYNRNLYTLNLGSISDDKFISAMSTAPEGSVIAIEDIDAHGVQTDRVEKKEKTIGLTLNGLLNGIDGVASPEDRILIATTNHIEKLDPALIRDGRFDLKLNIKDLNSEALYRYLVSKYDNFKLPEDYELNTKLSPATIQRLVFENKDDYNKVLEALK